MIRMIRMTRRAGVSGRGRHGGGEASTPGSWGLAAIGKKKLQVPHDNFYILGKTGFYFFLVCRAGRAMPGRFAETVGLDDSFEIFSWEESRPWRRLVRSANPPNPHSFRVPCYMCYMCYISQGKPLNIHSPPGSLLYVLYVLYLTRQATEQPLSPGSLLYVLHVLYLTRQATEQPLSPGSLLYVLYVLYGPI